MLHFVHIDGEMGILGGKTERWRDGETEIRREGET